MRPSPPPARPLRIALRGYAGPALTHASLDLAGRIAAPVALLVTALPGGGLPPFSGPLDLALRGLGDPTDLAALLRACTRAGHGAVVLYGVADLLPALSGPRPHPQLRAALGCVPAHLLWTLPAGQEAPATLDLDLLADVGEDRVMVVQHSRCPQLEGLALRDPGELIAGILLKWAAAQRAA